MLLDPVSSTELSIHGGSIAGLTLGLLAARSGVRTALVGPELSEPDTGSSTPGIASVQQELVHHHIRRWAGEPALHHWVEGTAAAQRMVVELATELGVPVHEMTVATTTTDGHEAFWLRHEAHAMRRAGRAVDFDDAQRLPFPTRPSLITPAQPVFDLTAYKAALLDAFRAAGGRLSTVPVPARRLVSATPKPVLDRYAMNPRLQQHTWTWHRLATTGADAVCSLIDDGGRLVLPDPRTGDLLVGSRRDDGRDFVATQWPGTAITATWQVPTSATFDALPFIGQAGPGRDREYVACGFDVFEPISGTLAGVELHRVIVDGGTAEKAFSPTRRPRVAAVLRAARDTARFGLKVSTVSPFPKAPLR